MTNALRSVAGVLLVGLMSPSVVYADPVTITSGVWTVRSVAGGGEYAGSLSGMDASGQLFSFEGVGTGGVTAALIPIPGDPVDSAVLIFRLINCCSDLLGQVVYGGEAYKVAGGSETLGEMHLLLEGSRTFDMLPLPPTTVTLIVPFQTLDLGNYFRYPDPRLFGERLPDVPLLGSGLAYVNIQIIKRNVGVGLSAELRFGESLTPEPTTALLFATGVLGLAMRRRRSQS